MPETATPIDATLHAWFQQRIPAEWFPDGFRVLADGEEIEVLGTLPDLEAEGTDGTDEAARLTQVAEHREATREARIAIAQEAERTFNRHIAWGARAGDVERTFTSISVPTMTRLRLRERRVLDTLIDAGVARSRSEALAWCVRLVGRNEDAWLEDLRSSLQHVERVRKEGPRSGK